MSAQRQQDVTESIATKSRILDAAEQLFADKGFAATSLRNITAEAGVNLAAVNYHFGSKAGLVEAVFRRRVEPLNTGRLQKLTELERGGGDDARSVEGILRTFIEPALRMSRDVDRGGAVFMRLLGRSYTEPSASIRRFMPELYSEVKVRYGEALGRALPHLDQAELYWRMHFVVGTLAYTMAGTDALQLLANCDYCDPSDVEGVIRYVVAFVSAGMCAAAGP